MGEDGTCEGTCEETCDKEISLKTNEALPLVSRWLEYQAAPKQKSKFKSITSGFFPEKPIIVYIDILYTYIANGWLAMTTLLSPASVSPVATLSTQSSHHLATMLGSLLSKNAEVFLLGTAGFENSTKTLASKKPQLDLLIRVGTAEDVQVTVCDT